MRSETRNCRRYRVSKIVTLLSFAVACLCLVVGAAGNGFEMEAGAVKAGTYDPPMIHVKATKSREYYDVVDQPDNLNFSVKVRGQCAERDRVYFAGLEVRGKDTQPVNAIISDGSDKRSIGPDHGAQWKVIPFSIPYVSPVQSPVYLCNDKLKQAGTEEARTELLQNGFNIDVAKGYYAALSITCEQHKILGLGNLLHEFAGAYLPVKVRCMPTGYKTTKGPPPRQGRHLEIDPPITSVSVAADPPETQGRQCPVYVNFKGNITAGEKSQYLTLNTEFRFVGDNGYQSEWLPVSVLRGESRSVHGRRFIQAPQNDPGSTFKTPGGRTKIPLYRGWMVLEVKEPDGVKRSERTAFSVDCNPPTPRIRR